MRDRRKSIALIGFMGAGKSTAGKLLADALDMAFVDLDEEIARDAGADIPAIFASEGEEGFRRREKAALQSALRGGGKVVSCGGGIVLRDDNVDLLRERSRVIYLRISAEEAVRRLTGEGGRPLLEGGALAERVEGLMEAREGIYLEAAHEVVEADGLAAEEVAEVIRRRCRR